MNDLISILLGTLLKPKKLVYLFIGLLALSAIILLLYQFTDLKIWVKNQSVIWFAVAAIVLSLFVSKIVNFLKDNEVDSTSTTIIDKFKDVKAEIDINRKVSEYITSNLSVQQLEKIIYEKTLTNIETHLIEKLDDKIQRNF